MDKILVVEDNSSMRMEICDILKMENFEVFNASDGLLALEIAKQKLPDLIVSDIMMPILDGYQLYDELNKDTLTQDIPFIFISALADKEYIRKGMNLGADDYLTKPLSVANLVKTVKKRIEKSKKQHIQIDQLSKNVGYFFPNQLRTPLNRIIGFTDYLLDKLKNVTKSEIIMILQSIMKSGKNIESLNENYLVLSKLFNKASNSDFMINRTKLPFIDSKKSIIQIIKKLVDKSERLGDLRIHISEAKLQIEREYIEKTVEALLQNALQLSAASNKIEIASGYLNKKYYLVVENEFTEELNEEISDLQEFTDFSQIPYSQKEISLKLAIVKKIVEIYKGTFELIIKPERILNCSISFDLK